MGPTPAAGPSNLACLFSLFLASYIRHPNKSKTIAKMVPIGTPNGTRNRLSVHKCLSGGRPKGRMRTSAHLGSLPDGQICNPLMPVQVLEGSHVPPHVSKQALHGPLFGSVWAPKLATVPSKTAFENQLLVAVHVFSNLLEKGPQNDPNPDQIQTKSSPNPKPFTVSFPRCAPQAPRPPKIIKNDPPGVTFPRICAVFSLLRTLFPRRS